MAKFYKFIKAYLSVLPWMFFLFPFGILHLQFIEKMNLKDSIEGSIIVGLIVLTIGAAVKMNKNK